MKNKIKIRAKMLARMISLSFIICPLSLNVALVSCSDWDDHYESDNAILDSQQATLWENISKNSNLSQFASLLKKAGYDEVLNASQTYTVWAPTDGTFDFETLNAFSKERLQKEFIQNHIARNNYPVSGAVNERIYTLNEKLMLFGGNGNYAIQNIGISNPNLASRNGVIHLLGGMIPLMGNIYEALNNNDYPLDSIANFFHSYDVKKLNEVKSVQGPMLNGQITYLDSVFDEHNDLFTRYFAYINREDSNYTMILPTNEAWSKAKATVEKFFNYVPSFEFMEETSPNDSKKTTVEIKDTKFLKDSIVNYMLTSSLFYNNNIYDNRKLNNLQTGQPLQCDSLYSTTLTKIYTEDAAALFANAQRVDKSNGAVWITDTMQIHPWISWNPEIKVEGEAYQTLASAVNTAGDPQRIYVTPGTQNPEVSGHVSNFSYVEAQPASMSTNPGVVFYLPEVRSTIYSVYIVMVPASITSSNIEAKPNKFKVSMGYAQATGKNKDNDSGWCITKDYTSDSTRVDTIYIGDFTFPVAYAGTGDYYPYLRINSAITSRERAMFDRTLRVDCVILRPKELDDYLKAHPDYKYDTGIY